MKCSEVEDNGYACVTRDQCVDGLIVDDHESGAEASLAIRSGTDENSYSCTDENQVCCLFPGLEGSSGILFFIPTETKKAIYLM